MSPLPVAMSVEPTAMSAVSVGVFPIGSLLQLKAPPMQSPTQPDQAKRT